MSYAKYRRDFEALERIAELDDQVSLDADRLSLMRNPTKSRAAEMYRAAIALWFDEHGIDAAPKIARRYKEDTHAE